MDVGRDFNVLLRELRSEDDNAVKTRAGEMTDTQCTLLAPTTLVRFNPSDE